MRHAVRAARVDHVCLLIEAEFFEFGVFGPGGCWDLELELIGRVPHEIRATGTGVGLYVENIDLSHILHDINKSSLGEPVL